MPKFLKRGAINFKHAALASDKSLASDRYCHPILATCHAMWTFTHNHTPFQSPAVYGLNMKSHSSPRTTPSYVVGSSSIVVTLLSITRSSTESSSKARMSFVHFWASRHWEVREQQLSRRAFHRHNHFHKRHITQRYRIPPSQPLPLP